MSNQPARDGETISDKQVRKPCIHETRAMLVWADIDLGIAWLVERLNAIPGVRTFASCQGTIGDGGAEPYGPYVMARWEPTTEAALREAYDIEVMGESWGRVRPRDGLAGEHTLRAMLHRAHDLIRSAGGGSWMDETNQWRSHAHEWICDLETIIAQGEEPNGY